MAERVFVMPDLGEGLEEGEIVAWLVVEGDDVALNQPLVEVETAKAAVEIPSPFAGRVVALGAPAGAAVPVGAPLVTFEVDTADVAPAPPVPDVAAPERAGPVAATPAVRAQARNMGLSIDAIAGTGPDGRVTSEDVAAAARATGMKSFVERSVETAPYDSIDVSGVRKMAADRLTKVVRETPLVTTFRTVDCTELQAVRGELGLSPLPIVIRALADTSTRHPLLNAGWWNDPPAIHQFRRVDAGIGIDTDHGLMIGVVRDVGARTAEEIAVEIRRLADAARTRTLELKDRIGSTLTVSNTGSYGSEAGTPIPESGVATVLAIGVIEPRALVVEGEVVARPACTLSLTFDHRVLDGATAGRGLTDLVALLQDGARLRDLAG
jgi:2-oxoisovalerate dehydrogenase E2 component (dihydrolipoyl transacylase)